MRPVRALALLMTLTLVVACSPSQERIVEDSAIGGTAGAGLGAVTGALIGNAIANGDVAASAMLGAAIGAPVGIVLGAYYAGAQEEMEIWQNDQAIQANERYLRNSQKEIDSLRQDLKQDMSRINLDKRRRQYQFNGQTLGNPFR